MSKPLAAPKYTRKASIILSQLNSLFVHVDMRLKAIQEHMIREIKIIEKDVIELDKWHVERRRK